MSSGAAAAARMASTIGGSEIFLESFWPKSLSRMSSAEARTRPSPSHAKHCAAMHQMQRLAQSVFEQQIEDPAKMTHTKMALVRRG